MKRRGRPGLGARHAHGSEGSEHAKLRAELILRVLAGEITVTEAAASLGVSEAHFHRLRERAIEGAIEALEPRPAGRPAAEVDPRDARIAELELLLHERNVDLRAAQLREEIALVMPHLLVRRGGEAASASAKKKEKKKRRRRRRR